MKKVTKILVPIDFSSCSENALAFAMQLADKINANIQVLNVIGIESEDSENPISLMIDVEEKKNISRQLMKKSIQKVKDRIGASLKEKPTFVTNIELGKVGNNINDAAKRNQIDYIVMGTQGVNSGLDKYLGSVASNVLKNAPCSVFVIPENAKFNSNKVLGYATNFMDADPYEIWKAGKLLKPFNPKIKCVHFNEKQVNSIDKIKEFEKYFAENGLKLDITFFSLPVKDKVKDLNDFIDVHKINMMVMYKPQRTFFDSLFHKSYTQKMAMHIEIPLLVLKEKE